MGRPTDYTPELADKILDRISDGQSLREICKADDMPGRTTVFRWLAAHAEFRELYALARECQADAFVDEIVHIADTPLVATIEVEKEVVCGKVLQPTTETRTSDAVDRSKLMVDARKWAAARLAPKKYGDRLELSGNVRHEDALDELERLEEAARAAAAPPAQD